jgi:glycosyltransferase involved in cell wall biosynthesis
MSTVDDTVFVVIPALNEASVIAEVIAGVRRYCSNVVLVDDGSSDGTGAAARTAGAHIVRHSINLGQGAALQTGITYALARGADYVVTFDADGQHEPADIPALIDAMRRQRVDVSLGSRFKGSAIGLPWHRRMLLQTARFVNFCFTGLTLSDAHNGMRALSRNAASKIQLRQAGMAHATEIVGQIGHHKLAFVEVPVTIRYTAYSMAKGQKLSNSVNILLDLVLRGLLR